MRDLAREAELEQRILEMAEEHGNKKWLRVKRTFFVLSGVTYFVALYIGLDYKIIDIKYLLSWLIASPVLAGFIMLISYGILYHIITGSIEEEKTIAKLQGKLTEMKSFDNNKDK